MRVDSKDLGLLAVGLAFAGFVVIVARTRTTGVVQPRYQVEEAGMAALSVANMAADSLDTGDHYFHPNYCVAGQTQIWTAHRYPAVSGGNVSTLIHRGMDALSQPAPQDDDWRVRPPAEVMWLCLPGSNCGQCASLSWCLSSC
jgi:hypothetical protein